VEVTPATEDDVPALSELLGVLFQQEAEFRPAPELQSAGPRAILGRADVGQVQVLRDGPAAGAARLSQVHSSLGPRRC
jgi:hypothetical protein